MDASISGECTCATYRNCTKYQSILHWFESLPDHKQRKFRSLLSQSPIPDGEAILRFGVSVTDYCVASTLVSRIPPFVQKCAQDAVVDGDFSALLELMKTTKA